MEASLAAVQGPPCGFSCDERLGPASADATPTPRRHLLFHGDNKDVLGFLRGPHREAIDLIYIDPPFDIGLDFGLRLPLGEAGRLDTPAYSDRWNPGEGSHTHMMWERLRLMRDLLKPSGCIFLHCDWRSSAVMRLVLDELFGPACFRNEIVWRRAPNLGRQAASNQLGRVAESILVYSARPGTPFLGTPPTKSHAVPLDAKGRPRGAQWDDEQQGYFTTAPRGDYTDQSIARLRAQGRIHDTPSGKVYVKYFLRRGDDGRWYKDQPVDTIWDDDQVRPLRHCSREELAVGYATQKPEGLLRRIIAWASPPGGLVADFFCGSGTTGVVAQRLGRRWIMADASPVAVRIARGRLIGEAARPDVEPSAAAFEVWRPDEHHAHAWFATACGGDVDRHRLLVL
ncbi:MAG: site-specific DNA-methyltransferase, partial [Phycisphaerae bacterium]